MASGRIEGNELSFVTKQYREFYLVSFWVEATLYGGYVLLFAVAMNVMRRRENTKSFSTRFHFTCLIVMFLLISLHNASNVWRMIHAYATIPETDTAPAAPVNYLRKCTNWDCYLFMVTQFLLTLTADILVIYRCYIVWHRSIRVIIPSCLLVLLSVGFTLFWLWWFKHPLYYPRDATRPYLGVHYPINFAQNILTTGLIAYRIWTHHLKSKKAGIHSEAGTSLVMVLRIIVESAMIWTIEMLLLIILYYRKSTSIDIVQHAMIPSIGIVFSLMAVRTHLAREEAASSHGKSGGGASTGGSAYVLPSWFDRSQNRTRDKGISSNQLVVNVHRHREEMSESSRRRSSMGDIELRAVDMKHPENAIGNDESMWK
ncbi:hypothetical protein DFP72DRAFT_1072704 [Ephemerocybe angulata]|uniref:Uncharacterized protein n=1 Tax=Ephemerocybe angulata TaxID=980116 RepID=A0A8H6HNX9_9AGAR|nr:hypothetical protein DFP72DRAFT_1072704 [Tulosesus angulatus]